QSPLPSALFSFSRFLPPRRPIPTPFPYTTLFRSLQKHRRGVHLHAEISGGRNGLGFDDLRNDRSHARPRALGGQFAHQTLDHHRSEETRLNSSHVKISYAVFCLKKKRKRTTHAKR